MSTKVYDVLETSRTSSTYCTDLPLVSSSVRGRSLAKTDVGGPRPNGPKTAPLKVEEIAGVLRR